MFKNAVTTLASAALLLLAAPASQAQTYTALTGEEVRSLLNTLGMDPEAPVKTDTGNLKVRFEDGSGTSPLFLTGCNSGMNCNRV